MAKSNTRYQLQCVVGRREVELRGPSHPSNWETASTRKYTMLKLKEETILVSLRIDTRFGDLHFDIITYISDLRRNSTG